LVLNFGNQGSSLKGKAKEILDLGLEHISDYAAILYPNLYSQKVLKSIFGYQPQLNGGKDFLIMIKETSDGQFFIFYKESLKDGSIQRNFR